MIKKIISVAFVAAVLSVGTYSYTQSQHEKSMNELTLANVEALAAGEYGSGTCWGTGPGGGNVSCPGGPYMCAMCHSNVYGDTTKTV